MEIPTIQIGAGNRMGRDSAEIRRRSRLHGTLYEPALDEVDCPGCGEMFTPKRHIHTHCLACRKEARNA